MSESREQDEQEPAPFDEDPPVQPDEPKVGNADARFFMPRDKEEREDDDAERAGGRTPDDDQP